MSLMSLQEPPRPVYIFRRKAATQKSFLFVSFVKYRGFYFIFSAVLAIRFFSLLWLCQPLISCKAICKPPNGV